MLASPKLDLQLKASTTQEREHPEHIAWSLKRKHYDSLRQRRLTPILLVGLMLPEVLEDAVVHTADELIVRRCAYWLSLDGMGPIEGNVGSTTVQLPRSNVFSPDALSALMAKISREEQL